MVTLFRIEDMTMVLENKLSRLVPEPVELSVYKSMLVIVDMQNDFLRPNGIIYQGPAAETIIQPLRELLEKARKNRVRVIFTKSWYDPEDPRFSNHPKAGAKYKGCKAGTWGAEIITELAPQGEPVITKSSYDCWFGTNLEETLLNMKFGNFIHGPVHKNRLINDCSVIITGVVTNVCVEKAVVGFYLRGYDIIIPIDCVAAADPLDQVMALYQFREFYAAKLTMSDLIKFLP